MAVRLASGGHEVRGYDAVPAARERAASVGVPVVGSLADAVDADVVVLMLPDSSAVRDVIDNDEFAPRAGALVIDMGSSEPTETRSLGTRLGARGVRMIDAPVSGGVKGATAGTLAFMVGGSDEAVERARPVLDPMAGKIIHCGASGTGQAAKLCNNMVLAVQQIAVGEAFLLAEKLGLSAQSLFDVITGATGNCWAVHTNCPVPGPVPTSPANNDFKPGFATALMNKDLGLAMDAVRSSGATAPLGTHAAEIYAKFATDHADKDFSAIIEMLR